MTLRYPDIFPGFVCTGSACEDNCCKMGWDIEIDENTLDYYRSLDTDLGRRLCGNIYEEEGCFYMSQPDGCPFLSGEGLCSVQQACGAEHISEICREHPRFYEWFGDYKEAGLGLCCEEVSRLVLTHERPLLFTEKQTDEPDDDLEFDSGILAAVKDLRDRLIDVAQDRGFTLLQRLVILAYCAEDIGEAMYGEDTERLRQLSGMLAIDGFRMEIVIQAQQDAAEAAKSHEKGRTKEQLTKHMLHMFSSMGYMGKLGKSFDRERFSVEKILGAEKKFSGEYAPYQYELENVLVYFLYRYLIKSVRDYSAEEHLLSAVYLTLGLRWLFLKEYAESGSLPDIGRRIFLAKEFSKEVEYDSDNMDIIYDTIQQDTAVRDTLRGLCM
ncbi:flagellin lysine-N-methylase [Ruminococcus sp.]|uniref:flagellin lysine-N-methylase n=1 Tax=Ruminococcus sp. TaxID=41978 RepID=UPI0025DCB40B|nr:flagellin lysine-N-methylase [Ruminococcus sp.]MBQ8965458.1 flagellin lysine-N-methylase [Ruminococcus sp.]